MKFPGWVEMELDQKIPLGCIWIRTGNLSGLSKFSTPECNGGSGNDCAGRTLNWLVREKYDFPTARGWTLFRPVRKMSPIFSAPLPLP